MEKVFMKFAVTLSLLAAVSLSSPASYGKGTRTDSDGHELVSLWKDYRQLQEEDRPDKEVEVLEKIMAQSEKRHIPWDFYDAWKKYRDAVLSRDWKQKEALDSAMVAAVRRFDEPVVSYAACRDLVSGRTDMRDMLCRLRENAPRLQSVRNPQFYRTGYNHALSSYYNQLPESVIRDIANDYEYVLWSLLLSSRGSGKQVYDMLSEYIAGRYPSGAYLEYYNVRTFSGDAGRTSSLEAFARKYEGKAVACYALQDLFSDRFLDMLENEQSLASSDFSQFRAECAAFEKMREKFSGSEKDIAGDCLQVREIIRTMDAENIRIESGSDTLDVLLRNIGRFSISVFRGNGPEGEQVFFSDAVNQDGNYYKTDTVRIPFPPVDDGLYFIRCMSGKTETSVSYIKNSISVAVRRSGEGIAVYAAEAESGRPLGKAGLDLFKGDSLVHSSVGLDFSTGFVSVPVDGLADSSGNSRGYRLVCSYRDEDGRLHSSGDVSIGPWMFYGYSDRPDGVRAGIFKDRAVYDSGDTLKFKTVLYRTSGTGTGLEVLPAGETVKMVFSGPGNTYSDSLELVTNDFGSVAGNFAVPVGSLGGRYVLQALYDGRIVASSSVVAGEKTDIPAFDLEFDKDTLLHFPGDSVVISGTVFSYTGHQLSSASMSWKVTGSDAVLEGKSEIGHDGRFSFGFRAGHDDYGYYTVEADITDLTGETHGFSKGITVSDIFTMDVEMVDAPEGHVTPSGPGNWSRMSGYAVSPVGEDTLKVRFTVRNADYQPVCPVPVSYSLYYGDELVQAGKVMSGDIAEIDLAGRESGLYRLEAESSAVMRLENGTDSSLVYRYTYDLIKTSEEDSALDADVEDFFMVLDGSDIALQVGTCSGPMWAVVELWGDDSGTPLLSDMVYLDGERGKDGSMTALRYGYNDSYPSDVRLDVLYFRNGQDYRYSAEYHRKTDCMTLPLSFSSFTDTSAPDTEVSVSLETIPEVEAVVSVFDAGTEQIMSNTWYPVSSRSSAPYVYVYTFNGFTGCRHFFKGTGNSNSVMYAKAVSPEAGGLMADAVLEESSAVPYGRQERTGAVIRSDFRNTLAFIPFLRSGNDSTITVTFRTSDKLSTYDISVFAHGRSMRNNTVSGQMTVTKPVMVSVSSPHFLREGDIYVLDASVSNSTDEDVTGTLELFVYETENYKDAVPVLVKSIPMDLDAGGRASGSFSVEVPGDTDSLGFKVLYAGFPDMTGGDADDGRWSDGLFMAVPVLPDTQSLVESHSSVLLPGMSPDSLKAELYGQFVNTLPYGAVSREISLLDMVKDAVPRKAAVRGKDAVSVSDALFVRMLTGAAYGAGVDSLVTELSECQNKDGGFAWFRGMESSPVITALLLERAAEICGRTHVRIFTAEQEKNALAYLDRGLLAREAGAGRAAFSAGAVSIPEYMYVRSMYPSVPLAVADSLCSGKELKGIRKSIRAWLTAPTGSDMFDGMLIDKARRISAGMALLGDGGSAMAESLGLGRSALRKISRIMDADAASLCAHAVEHESGGMYFPNAVMPFRGLLDSELYAHSLICDVLRDYSCRDGAGRMLHDSTSGSDIASASDGVRLWMMIQKETQQWDSDPACVRAMASVLDGSRKILSAKVIIVDKRYEKPYDRIEASGNGFTVSCGFFREDPSSDGGFSAVAAGDVLSVGERIVCRYTIKSSENRSFVKLSVPHCAFMQPVNQISGMTGWWKRVSGFRPAPAAYRNLLTDRTEYYFNVLPEETTVIEEEFFVTRSGAYSSPVAEVECSYAPHYRANDGFRGITRSIR